MRAQVELTAECPECHTRGVWIELYDPVIPATALGLPAQARCRLCAAEHLGECTPGSDALTARVRPPGECPFCAHALDEADLAGHACGRCKSRAAMVTSRAGDDLRDPAALERAVRALMAAEGDDELGDFVQRCFNVPDLAALGERYAQGGPVDTSLDGAVGFLSGAVPRAPTPPPPPAPAVVVAHGDDRRAMLLALVSVLMADGQRDPRETPLVEAFLKAEGLAPLAAGEMRVHRPVEVAGKVPPARREGLLSLMAQLAYADGLADPSEVRVLRAFADAWAMDQAEVDRWLETYRLAGRSRRQRVLDRLRSFFLAG